MFVRKAGYLRPLISVPRRLRLILGVACLLILAGTQPLWAIFTIQYNGTQIQFSGVSNPSGLALDLAGNLYIADTGNHRILKVPAGSTTPVLFPITIGGTSVTFSGSSPNQMTVDSAGNLYITDPASNRIIKSDPSGNGTVLGTGAISLSGPKGVAVDTFGDVFIADTGNSQIVEIPSGGSAAVLAITGVGALNTPKGLAIDTFDNLYIADSNNNRVIKVNPSLVGSVVGISGLSNPIAVAVQNNGTIYVVDGQAAPNDRIAILDPQGDQYDMFNDEIDDAFGQPTAIAIDAQGGFYLTTVNAVNLFHQGNAGFGHVALGSSGTPITLNFDIGFFTQITGVAVYTEGTQNLDFTIAANSGTPCSTAIDTTGGTVRCTVNVQFTPTATGLRRGALVLSYSNEFFAPQTTGSFTVPLFGIGDGPAVALSPGTASQLSTGSLSFSSAFRPFQTAFDGVGNIYATDTDNNRILKIPAGGGAATVVSIPALPSSATGLSGPTGLAIDGAGNLFISDTGHNRIVEVTSSGNSQVVVACLVPASSLPPLCATDYSFNSPKSLFIDGAGNLIVDDAGNNKIVQLTTNYALSNDNTLGFTNAFVRSTGTFVFAANSSMAVDSRGSLYISDDTNNRIIKVDRLGNSSLVDFSSLSSGLSTPHSVALDPMGNIYVMDAGGNAGSSRVIRKVMSGDTSVLAFSGTSLGSAPNQIAVDNLGNVLVADYTDSSSNGRLVQINVGQSALPFASPVQKDSSSTESLTATVTNVGNQPLVFSANPSYTANFSQDTSDTNPCTSGTSLATSMNCNVAIKFTPKSVGSLSAYITVTNNERNIAHSIQQIAVSGTATNPADTTSVTVTPTPSAVKLGQSVSLTTSVADTTTGHSANVPTGSVAFTDTVNSSTVPLNGGAAVPLDNTGKAVLSGVMLSGVGTHSIQASYLGVTDSYLPSDNTTTVTVNPADATLTGPMTQPIAVTVGQTGSANLTVTGVTGIAVPNGTITYSLLNASNASVVSGSLALTAGASNATASVPLANTLAAGNYTISVTYNGDSNYAASATPVGISVAIGKMTQAVLAVTGMPTSSQAYGAIFTVGSSGGSGTGAVTFAATGACSVDASSGAVTMTSGNGTCSVTATKAADGNYLTATSTAATVTASKAIATVTAWPTASAITYGQTLASSTLVGGSALVGGTFAWTAPATAPSVGTAPQSVTFTPTDTTNYNPFTGTAAVTVNKATATVTTWPTASAITYGQTLASSTLSGGSASVGGTFVWTAPTTAPNTGTAPQSVTFTPTDTTNYNPVTGTASMTVNKATATVTTWPTASAITYGQTLASSTLSGGAASVGGTFVFTTPTTAPNAGTAPQSVTFTPTDTTNYNPVTGTASVTVSKATPTVTTWPSATGITYGQTLASSTLSGGSASVGGTFVWTAPTTAPNASMASQSVTFTPVDTTNYGTVTGTANVTVNKVTPTVTTWPSATGIAYGHTLASSALSGGSASVGGTFTWTTPTTAPNTGTTSQSVTFTPTDTTNYNPATGAASVTVSKATASLTLSSPLNLALVGNAVTFTAMAPSRATGTVDFYDGTTRLASVTLSQGMATYTTSGLAAGTHSITASYSGDNNFQSATSAALPQNVIDYTVTGSTGATGGSGGSGSTGVPTQTVQPGGTATYNVQVAPSLGTIAPADVILTVTHNLPAGSSAVLSASGVSTSGSTLVLPGGQAMPAVQLTVHVASPTAALHRSNPLSTMPFAFGFLLLPFGGKMGRAAGKRVRRSGLWLVLLLVGLAAIAMLAGCGAVNTGYSAERNYTITVTATSGTLSHSTNFNLTVQ